MHHLINEKGKSKILLILIIPIIILISVFIYKQEQKIVKSNKLESSLTDMITIKSKSKIYYEEIYSELIKSEDKDNKIADLMNEKHNMIKINNINELVPNIDTIIDNSSQYYFYQITKNTLNNMGLNQLQKNSSDNDYIVAYNSTDTSKLEVIYVNGINYNNSIYYTLSSLQKNLSE